MEFSVIGLLLMLLIAAVCGAAGQAIAGYSMGGLLASIGVGFIGALLGTWIAGNTGLPELLTIDIEGKPFPIIWSIIGATLFALLISFVRAPRRRRRV
ncbi:GlsB/YeaQ/YmgE family stress response membrane protein [Herpetosiphon llansteffanensis]|uniref:GlsB/YeaQ/YmgE family stress response membrane protein n=1 Tax=Herpetosiphon llansteffanensis TaxID=2094568 RepID=UPI000D7C4A79|nr:GlsB/YeaQ/YmgE family stress response membrane protein [Herpetosiphon llansteffanensis]